MPLYENVFIARQDVSSQQVEAMAEDFTKLVADNGGAIAKTEFWGVRGLTYRIKKNRKGHYVLMNLDAPSDAVQELERQMRLHEDVIRYMTVRVEELEEGPSAMMQSRGGRGGRGLCAYPQSVRLADTYTQGPAGDLHPSGDRVRGDFAGGWYRDLVRLDRHAVSGPELA